MGLLDVLNGMQNGPRGQRDPNQKSGMSPITMAILALLAYKGLKHFGGQMRNEPAPTPLPTPDRPPTTSASGGGLGDILGGLLGGGPSGSAGTRAATGGAMGDLLKGGLGGLLAGGAAGSVLGSGLGGLLKQFEQSGQGQAAQSWIGTGPNADISESDLAKSIGVDDIDMLTQHTGLSREELLAGLRNELPGAIDELTPNGRLPTDDEASRWV